MRLYDSDIIPFHGPSGSLVLVNGLLGEFPMRFVGTPEKTEMLGRLGEAVKVVGEKTSSSCVVSHISEYPVTDWYLYLQDVFLQIWLVLSRTPISTLP